MFFAYSTPSKASEPQGRTTVTSERMDRNRVGGGSNKVAFPAPSSLRFAMQNALHLLSPSFYMCAMRAPAPLAGPATPPLCS